ncbi:MAG: molecular chaperone DnaJ [Kiritimatiellae bacterium]|nr:molecular chaperone DnaJ [Kiritimatiellia bacterium]
MAEKRDYYEVLGVPKTATADEIKSAYRKLAMKWHPDRNPDKPEAKDRFSEISEAYEVLSNPEKRQHYDQFGHAGVNFGPGGFDFGRDFSDGDILKDLFGGLFGGGGGGFNFGDLFGGGGRRRQDPNAPQRGADMTMQLDIDFEEALFGSQRTLTINLPEECPACGGTGAAKGTKRTTCPHCRGRGQIVGGSGFFQVRQTCPRCGGAGSIIESPCPACRGTGETQTPREITLRIPQGVDTGSRLRLTGKGAGGVRGGPAGDLYVVLNVRESDIFERDGTDLAVDVPVSPFLAALGGKVEVPTPDGAAEVKIAPGTPNGKVLRLRGKGVRDLRTGNAGDLLVRFVIEAPARLTSAQRVALEKAADALDDANFPARRDLAARQKTFLARRDVLKKA